MSALFLCPNGHLWDGERSVVCPECGQAGVSPADGPEGVPAEDGEMPPLPQPDLPSIPEVVHRLAVRDQGPEPPAIPGYEILAELGRGGMGVVFKARQLRPDRVVALKVIRAGPWASPEERARFRDEAEAAARLQHPNLVPIYEVNEHAGLPYFSMEFVNGGSLRDHLRGAPLPADPAARLVETLARAIHYAHERRIVHRDLTPANVLLQNDECRMTNDERIPNDQSPMTKEEGAPLRHWGLGIRHSFDIRASSFGIPKITDFGLAKRLGEAGLTDSGRVLGTPEYMAPEQALGRTQEVGPAADVYALGAILYECLTGRPPFKGATQHDTVQLVRSAEPVPPRRLQPTVPRDLETICLKCLEKDPHKRYASADVLADRLLRFQKRMPIPERPLGPLGRALKWAKREPVAAALVAVSAVALFALGGVGVGMWFNARLQEKNDDLVGVIAERDQANKDLGEASQRAVASDYYHRIGLAEHEWQVNNVVRVRQLLDECPRELRGWEWHYLDRLCRAELLTIRGHKGSVNAVAFSPDGRFLASGGVDGTVKLWEATTGVAIRELAGHPGSVNAVAFSPDGARLAAGGAGARGQRAGVILWEVAKGRQVGAFECRYTVRSVAFSPDAQRLAVAGEDEMRVTGEVRVWDVATGAEAFRPITDCGGSVAFNSDGTRLTATGFTRGFLARVLNAATGEEVLRLPGTAGRGCTLAICPATGRLALAGPGALANPDGPPITLVGPEGAIPGATRYAGIWDTVGGKPRTLLIGHTSQISSLTFSRDGRRIASASWDPRDPFHHGETKVGDPATGLELFSFKGHAGGVRSVAFSPDGKRLASAGVDGTVKVWDATISQEFLTLRAHSRVTARAVFSPDGKCLATLGGNLPTTAEVKIWNPASGQPPRELPLRVGLVFGLTYSPDGHLLAAAVADKLAPGGSKHSGIKIWDIQSGREALLFGGQPAWVRSVAFSPNSRYLAAALSPPGNPLDKPGSVKVWDVAGRQELFSTEGPPGGFFDLAFSTDGKYVATAGRDGIVRLWDAMNGKEVRALPRQDGEIRSVAFSPDGRRLAAAVYVLSPLGREDNSVKVWDLGANGAPLTLSGQPQGDLRVAFSPDGRRLATAGRDGVIIWDPVTGQAILTLRGQYRSFIFHSVAFSPDGMCLAAALSDGTVRIWDATPRNAVRAWAEVARRQ